MAAQIKKRSVPNRTTRNVKRRRPAAGKRFESRRPSRIGSFVLPLFLSFCLLVCLTALGTVSYQSVTASNFFDVQAIEIRGVERSSKDGISRIISSSTEKSGAWNADLTEIKAKVEKLQFVKTASVSRVLPDGIRVRITERVPAAIVKLSSGNVLADSEANILAPVSGREAKLPFLMVGWDESKTEKAVKDNLERVKMYQKMLADWQQFDLASRVSSVNLADLREPKAMTEDSGLPVSISVGKDEFGEHLRMGINAIVGKGETFDAVDLVGQNMILSSRKKQEAVQAAAR